MDTTGVVEIGFLAGTGIRNVNSTATGALTNATSDARLKENIFEIQSGLDKVMAMRPITYTWKDTDFYGDQTEMGFIAQEMREICPEVVGENSDGMLSLDYAKLVAVQAKAIQELAARVAELENA